ATRRAHETARGMLKRVCGAVDVIRAMDAHDAGSRYVGSAKVSREQDRAEKAAADPLLHDELPSSDEGGRDAAERRPIAAGRYRCVLDRVARSIRGACAAPLGADASSVAL